MPEAKISIPFNRGSLEIEGSEAFVKEHLSYFKEVIDEALREANEEITQPIKNNAQQLVTKIAPESMNIEYENVLEIHDGKVHVISDIPGSSNKQKTVNASLLFLLGSKLAGIDEVGFDPVRDVCRNHGFLDSTNFSKYLKSEKSLFVISGTGKSQVVKLSQPGFRKAIELASELNALT